ncbi:transposase [Methylicorpusculum sp.]|uniref:REP-associated tyrosine transposase n=1 Tax=Methylicorpusculum sp. TaxID=2713644 RepID=UPI0027289ACB|nr:transposase [Methylicorpusculum sp.]MDO8844626.1 transposase [Methylicorpusculum sp.]
MTNRCPANVGATPTSRLKGHKKPNPHGRNLRKGRVSSPGQIYLITTVTQDREPFFYDFNAARMLIKTMKNEQELGRANTLAFVVMPDHLHWLMELSGDASLSKVMQSLKALSAKAIGQPIWQAGFHDHALRKEEDIRVTARYIIANPLRAGLVKHVGDYPHWDAIWLGAAGSNL